MQLDDPRDLAKLVGREACRRGKGHRLEPELGEATISPHVDVRWFCALVAEEEQPVGTGSEGRWHLRCVASYTTRVTDLAMIVQALAQVQVSHHQPPSHGPQSLKSSAPSPK